MTKTRTFVVALSLCTTVACSEQGPMPTSPASPSSLEGTNAKPPGGGPPPADVAVTSTIGAGDIGGVGGVYTNTTSAKSIIQTSNGVWYLDSNPLTISLNFGNPIAGTGPGGGNPVAPASGPDYQVFMYTACNLDYNVNLLTMPINTPTPCPMAVRFEAGGKRYLLRMNENQDGSTEVDDVTITRLVQEDPSLTTWQIRPSAGVSNRARLFYQGKGNAGLVTQGDYNMSFSIDVTNP